MHSKLHPDGTTPSTHRPPWWIRWFVRVPMGPLQGFAWMPLCGGKMLRVLLGTYEPKQTQRLLAELKFGDVFLDVGAHVGWYSVLAAPKVGSTGRVVAFEASPRNFWFLKHHVERNGLSNVDALHLGVAQKSGTLYFAAGRGTGTGRLVQKEAALASHAVNSAVPVAVNSLDEYCDAQGLVPTHIKIDVEGGELNVLAGMQRLFAKHRPMLFLSTHGDEIKASCVRQLSALGYRFEPLDGDDVSTAADLLCLPPNPNRGKK